MRGIILVVFQLVVSVLLVGLLAPAVLLTMPSAREARRGPIVIVVLGAAVFVALRWYWPRGQKGK